MSKKTNSLVFILIATVVNIVITLVCLLLLLVLYARVIVPLLPAESAALGIPVIFICAVIISFLIYRAGIKLFSKKVDIEKNFDPLFHGRKQQAKKDID
jgi:Na+-driven multidrug efflux pump